MAEMDKLPTGGRPHSSGSKSSPSGVESFPAEREEEIYRKKYVTLEKFIEDLSRLEKLVEGREFDAIVAPKRSGLIPGAYLAFRRSIPLLVPSEVDSVPQDLKRVLLVDTTIWKGKTIRKILNRLGDRKVTVAVLYKIAGVEFLGIRPLFVEETEYRKVFWYEKGFRTLERESGPGSLSATGDKMTIKSAAQPLVEDSLKDKDNRFASDKTNG